MEKENSKFSCFNQIMEGALGIQSAARLNEVTDTAQHVTCTQPRQWRRVTLSPRARAYKILCMAHPGPLGPGGGAGGPPPRPR